MKYLGEHMVGLRYISPKHARVHPTFRDLALPPSFLLRQTLPALHPMSARMSCLQGRSKVPRNFTNGEGAAYLETATGFNSAAEVVYTRVHSIDK